MNLEHGEPTGNSWRAMASAPRDGQLLLLHVPGIDGLRRHSNGWPDVTLGYFSDRMVRPGWYSVEREDSEFGSVMEIELVPDRWMKIAALG